MTGKRLLAALTGALMLTSVLPVPTGAAEPKLVDAGIDYTEDVRTVNNPGAGYTSTLWYVCKPGATEVKNPQGNLVLMFVDIGAFSSGANGKTNDDKTYTEGKDYDLDAAFFKGMRGTLENCRKNGCTVAVRFRYDANGKTNPEPATFEQVLHHIDQIKADGFLEDYKDILMYVESGFVGASMPVRKTGHRRHYYSALSLYGLCRLASACQREPAGSRVAHRQQPPHRRQVLLACS